MFSSHLQLQQITLGVLARLDSSEDRCFIPFNTNHLKDDIKGLVGWEASSMDVEQELALLRQDLLILEDPSKHPLFEPVCLGEFPLHDVAAMKNLQLILTSLLTRRRIEGQQHAASSVLLY